MDAVMGSVLAEAQQADCLPCCSAAQGFALGSPPLATKTDRTVQHAALALQGDSVVMTISEQLTDWWRRKKDACCLALGSRGEDVPPLPTHMMRGSQAHWKLP